MKEKRKCHVNGCDNEAKQMFGGDGNYYCGKHLHHMYRHGKILEHHRRSDLEYYIENDIIHIKLFDNYGVLVGEGLIDSEDLEVVKHYKCTLSREGYVRISNRKYKTLHHFLFKPPKGYFVDHINGIRTDNRRNNLRMVTPLQNSHNTTNKGRGVNKRKGVSYKKDRDKWRAYITVEGKQVNLGSYTTEDEAIKARERAEIEYFGDYRRE